MQIQPTLIQNYIFNLHLTKYVQTIFVALLPKQYSLQAIYLAFTLY